MTPLSLATDKLAEALALNPASNVHTVYESTKVVNGVDTGVPCVVALVPTKLPESQVKAYHLPVPQSVHVGNGEVPVDVQEAPEMFDGAPFRTLILQLESRDSWGPAIRIHAGASEHQRCFSPLCPGGVQISPNGASWVGSIGVPWHWEGKRFGFLTNRHVAGLDRQLGDRICQPHGQANPIGYLAHFEKLNTTDPNEFDIAVYDCELNGKHYVSQGEIHGIGKIKPGIVDLAVGDVCGKSGRTTGVTAFKCIGKNAATTISYGQGRNLKFVGLDIFQGDRGDPSAPGDSGSAILRDSQFGALLFAGGNGKTLAIPARKIQERIGGVPFA